MEPESRETVDSCARSVKAGAKDDYRRIVGIMLPTVRAYVTARSFPGMDVDEIVQQTFVEAYKNIGDYREGTDFRAWLVTIARYQTMMEATRLRRQADYHSRFVPVAVARQMERRLTDDEDEDDRLPFLRECLEQVKETSRDLLRHRYQDDLSMKDIAAALNRTAGAVRKELCLVRKQLHECVEHKMSLDTAANQ